MKPVVLAAILCLALPASAEPALGKLVMSGPDSARVVYADKCANGGNNDVATRNEFVNAMLAQPKSKLALRKQELQKGLDERLGERVQIGEPMQTYHDRDGCGSSHNSFSFFVLTVGGGNTNHAVVKFLVTIDDDDDSGTRTLALRSIQPMTIRDEKF